MKKVSGILLTVLIIILSIDSQCPAEEIVSFSPDASGVNILRDGVAADIYYDVSDDKVVSIAAEDLADDIERVTGVRPDLHNDIGGTTKHAIIIGSIDKSEVLEMLGMDFSSIEGTWETFTITTVDNPLPGVEKALVIAGSDRRGTAYSVYELSKQIGVSPWYWWADSAPEKHDTIIATGGMKSGPPAVKYRGIFLNDEAHGLNPWAAQTFEPETGDIGPETYEKIFELLLRLKANYIWPAMKRCTHAFNYYEDNKLVADDYAIVMGSSHCEQMLRDNIDEWQRDGTGRYDYVENRDGVLKYWEDRVRENARFENIYTMGMRGIYDSDMPGGGAIDDKTERLELIIKDQRNLLRKYVNEDVTKVPQIFSPYKEVLDLYRNGMKLPDDIAILWTDDNYGFIRSLSNPEERKRAGGAGVYYHMSYSGRPHDYLWLNTTPPALIWEEMRKAYEHNAREVWVLNVGDLKPAEIGIEYFIDLGWHIDKMLLNYSSDFLRDFADREFGDELKFDIARILDDYYYINHIRKPENLGWNETYPPNTNVEDPEFSLVNYGDEVSRRLDFLHDLEARATAVYEKIPERQKDTYFQLVLYPVRCTMLMNEKVLYAYKSREYAKQGRISANDYAAKSDAAYDRILEETRKYNEGIAGGKWKLMMSHEQADRLIFRKMKTGKVKEVDKPGMRVIIEGSDDPVPPISMREKADKKTYTINYYEVNPGHSDEDIFGNFIDVYNLGTAPFDWKAETSANWIALSETSGTVDKETRLRVNVKTNEIEPGKPLDGSITFSGAGPDFVVDIHYDNPDLTNIPTDTFIQKNGVISINAEDAVTFRGGKDGEYEWRPINDLGRTGGSITIMPSTMPSIDSLDDLPDNAPVAEYPIHVFKGGKARIEMQALPTQPTFEGNHLRCAVSIDDGEPVWVEFEHADSEFDNIWKRNVLRVMMEGKVKTEISDGPHTLKVWGADPSIVLDKIIINFGGLKKSYLGPPETRVGEF